MTRLSFSIGCSLRIAVLLTLWLTTLLKQMCLADGLPIVEPASVGMDTLALTRIEGIINEGIAEKKMPGCVVCCGRHGKIAYLKSFGNKQVGNAPLVMTTDTVFDLASLTKPVATATSIMKLVELGKIRLGNRVTDFFPEFAPNGKHEITIQDLLIHQSGLIPDNALSDYLDGPEVAWERICELELVEPVGTKFKYSDVNFIVLAEIVRKVSGQNIHEFSQANFFGPLGMSETGFLPRAELRALAAPTEKRNGDWMRGEVHDPRAFELGGVAGHAGLFSTAQELAVYAQMMLGEGTLRLSNQEPIRILSPQTVATMTNAYTVSNGQRGLGWDKRSGYSSNRGDLLSESAFGHGGFTGTVLWIDPEQDLFFIFLSNRVHPNGDGNVNHLAGQIANVIAGSVNDLVNNESNKTGIARIDCGMPVLAGVDVLERDQFRQLTGQRVGLITNQTGRNRTGVSTAELLHLAPNVNLVALFSPEHGWEGQLDESKIGDSVDAKTGLKIFSLYGETHYGETHKPSAEMLSEVDTLVFDIQDIGTRFYTYISTMGEAMQAASESGKHFVVLDRPNPINGVDVAGPMLDHNAESFVGFHQLPVRHGMTMGEIAMLLKGELKLELDLQVVRCEGWHRQDYWERTNLTWINPSPNMRSLTQALLYPGVGLLETTNVSVGRGTDTPFEVLGAPWIDGMELAARLNTRQLPGVIFIPIKFTPNSSKFAGQACAGINIAITDRKVFEPVRCGLEIACQLRSLYPKAWETKNFNRLLGNQLVFESVLAGESGENVFEKSLIGLSDFKHRRSQYLLYR